MLSRSNSSKAVSSRGHFFFRPLAAATGSADASRRAEFRLDQFLKASANRHATHAGDAGEEGNATTPVVLGQSPRDEAATFLVQESQEVIEGAMLASHRAGTMFLTVRALTQMGEALLLVIHGGPHMFAMGRKQRLL
jgi:hypothetical protein